MFMISCASIKMISWANELKVTISYIYRDVWIAGLDFQLGESPDVVGELDCLVDHVLTLEVALGNREHIVLVHLRGHAICWNKNIVYLISFLIDRKYQQTYFDFWKWAIFGTESKAKACILKLFIIFTLRNQIKFLNDASGKLTLKNYIIFMSDSF